MDERIKQETQETAETEKAQRSERSAAAEECAAAKKRFRTEALLARDSLTAKQRADYSGRIIKKLTGLSCYQDAAALLVYVNFRSEVETKTLIETALRDDKAVFAPAVSGREMAFFKIDSMEELRSGYQGILEPVQRMESSYGTWILQRQRKAASAKTLLCMPGAAFDRERNRIGYGGGYYDRYLSALLAGSDISKGSVRTIALAFSCQVFEKIPNEAHDLRPEKIVTEREIIADAGCAAGFD